MYIYMYFGSIRVRLISLMVDTATYDYPSIILTNFDMPSAGFFVKALLIDIVALLQI